MDDEVVQVVVYVGGGQGTMAGEMLPLFQAWDSLPTRSKPPTWKATMSSTYTALRGAGPDRSRLVNLKILLIAI